MTVFRRSNKTQVSEFTKQLATMLSAGIKLTEALSVLVQQISDNSLKNAITDIRDRVVTGESFADALVEYKHYFDIIYISMIRVGRLSEEKEIAYSNTIDDVISMYKRLSLFLGGATYQEEAALAGGATAVRGATYQEDAALAGGATAVGLISSMNAYRVVMNDCLEHLQLFVDSDIAVARLTVAKREEVRALWTEGDTERIVR